PVADRVTRKFRVVEVNGKKQGLRIDQVPIGFVVADEIQKRPLLPDHPLVPVGGAITFDVREIGNCALYGISQHRNVAQVTAEIGVQSIPEMPTEEPVSSQSGFGDSKQIRREVRRADRIRFKLAFEKSGEGRAARLWYMEKVD